MSASVVGSLVIYTPAILAAPLRSGSYIFQETSLGGVGNSGSASTNYQAINSGGIIGNGNSASANNQINGGNTTSGDPALSFAIISGSASFNSFSPGTATTATTSFQVSNYTSYGYVVQILGNTPTNGSHNLAAMASTGPSQAGVEQFGVNLVANTSPVSLGTNPDHGQFGFGSAASNYGTTNNYRYVSGETIVTGPKSGGLTTYTISYIVNVSSLTPGGQYSGAQTIICTGTY